MYLRLILICEGENQQRQERDGMSLKRFCTTKRNDEIIDGLKQLKIDENSAPRKLVSTDGGEANYLLAKERFTL